jgi:hypothetical protein
MNHKLWNSAGARVIAMTLLIAGLTACGERLSDVSTKNPKPLAASPSTQVIGQAPAEPLATADAGTPVGSTPSQSEVSKSVQSTSMPLPGQPNDHSTDAPGASQKAGSEAVLKSPAAARNANSAKPSERAPS